MIYDVQNNKRRQRVVKWLKRFGIRVQRSAFEITADTNCFEMSLSKISDIIDLTNDSVRIYYLGMQSKVLKWGKDITFPDKIIIV